MLAGSQEINIRPLTAEDVYALQQISRQTFSETFAQDNTPDDLAAYLDKTYNQEALLKLLNHPKIAFFGAFQEEKLLGYLMVATGSAQSEEMPNDHMELSRIYVLASQKNCGIGSKLMQIAIEQARKAGKTKLWLGVWEHNYPAQKFYSKHGFKKTAEHVFVLGDSHQTDWIMTKNII